MKNNHIILFGTSIIVGLAIWNAYSICKPPRKYYVNRLFLWEHELIHWEQYQKLGFLGFYKKYFNQYFKDGYDKIEMEKEARIHESPFCQENYLFCKRTGIAKTSKS